MTAASLTHLPLQAGSVALASAGRAALWVIARYMRNPLTHTAIAALVVTSALAGSNALYGQAHPHPRPLFAPAMTQAAVDPVVPADRPKNLYAAPAKLVSKTPAALPDAAVDKTDGIDNKDVFEVQRKLWLLNLFTGTVDGIYGPQTAKAIKKFEQLNGLKPAGKLSPKTIAKILATPISAAEPVEDAPKAAPLTLEKKPAQVLEKAAAPADSSAEIALPDAEPAPTVLELAPAKPADAVDETTTNSVKPRTLAALPDPKPLSAELTPVVTKPAQPVALAEASEDDAPKLLGRPLPQSADEALTMASKTAGDAIDTIISGVETLAKPDAALPFSDPRQKGAKVAAKPGVPLDIDDAEDAPGTPIQVLDTNATPDQLQPRFSVTDPVTVAKVQRGLASLGFLHAAADGVAGEATAKAIRNFEVYFNYDVTGRISPGLIDLLVENGAVI